MPSFRDLLTEAKSRIREVDTAEAEALIAHLRSEHILSVFHYLPLHLSEMGQHYGGQPGDCPVTERLGDCLLRLPLYNDLTENDQARVIDAIHRFDGWA